MAKPKCKNNVDSSTVNVVRLGLILFLHYLISLYHDLATAVLILLFVEILVIDTVYMHIKSWLTTYKELETFLLLPQKYQSGTPVFCQAGLWMNHPTSCGLLPDWPNLHEHRTAGTNWLSGTPLASAHLGPPSSEQSEIQEYYILYIFFKFIFQILF